MIPLEVDGVIDLKPFCGSLKKCLMQPFSFGEHTYATNGHIIVRVPRRGGVPELTDDRPTVEKLNWDGERGEAAEIPELPERIPEECGDAWEDEETGYRVCCEDKDDPCDIRAGEGICWKLQSIHVGPGIFNVEYLRLIKGLPGYVFYPVAWGEKEYSANASYFTFDGGDGLLMPCKEDYK